MNINNNGTSETRLALRTQEINELLGKSPNYLISWGTTWFLVIVAGFFVITAFVKYPETINGDVNIILSQSRQAGTTVHSVALFKEEFASKLMAGQKASIKLKSYPSMEFGTLEARIDSISRKLVNNNCEVYVSISSLRTSNNINVANKFNNLNGSISVIITQETLLKRILSKK